jgi:hypothetical protein
MFDRNTITLSCSPSPPSGGVAPTSSTTWASLEAAVASDRPIGRRTLSQSAVTGSCPTTTAWSYDAAGRPLSTTPTLEPGASSSCLVLTSLAFSAWDPFARPTAATFSRVNISSNASCTGTITNSYDDANNTITGSESACGILAGSMVVVKYDSDGIVIGATSTLPDGRVATSTDTILATAQICK